MKTRLLFVLFVLFFPYYTFSSVPADSLLQVLKVELARKDIYDRKMEGKISNLRQAYGNLPVSALKEKYNITLALFDLYKDYRFDSTFYYAQRLVELSTSLGDDRKLAENRLRLGKTLISSGMFKETFDNLRATNAHLLDLNAKKSYYILYSWAYSDLAKYNSDRFYAPQDLVKKFLYLDSAIALTQAGSFERLILEAQRKEGTLPHPSVYYNTLYKRKLSLHEEAMVATGLSRYRHGNEKIRLLAIAAINDLRTSTYRAEAMFSLGKALYEEGKIEEAYYFLKQAMVQANTFGSRMQQYQVAHLLPKVAAERERITERERERFLMYTVCILVLAVIATLIGFIIFVQLKKVRAAQRVIKESNDMLAEKNKQLWEAGKIREEYIGYFFSELSRYIIKLDKLKRNVQRRVKSGNIEEVLNILDKVDIGQERTELFKTFDQIFLKLFPDFVAAVNSMFEEKDQMKPRAAGALSPQLRIFALMRLGISKNEMIAAILEYTVNTVYTYRFRAKSKALVSGGDFEQQIMGIQLNADAHLT